MVREVFSGEDYVIVDGKIRVKLGAYETKAFLSTAYADLSASGGSARINGFTQRAKALRREMEKIAEKYCKCVFDGNFVMKSKDFLTNENVNKFAKIIDESKF